MLVTAEAKTPSERLHGLDFARFLAFAGMVFVNFHVVTGSGSGGLWATGFLVSLEGKAAATFVVLAGIGLGLGVAYAASFVLFGLDAELAELVTASSVPPMRLYTLEGLGMLGGQSAETAIAAASLFIIISVIYVMVWSRFFKAGPFEWLMRRVTG